MTISEIINHLGEDREKYFNAVSPPIIQSSNFSFPTVQSMREALGNELQKHVYTRGNNPTVEILRKKIAALEGAEDALITSSGSAAISCAVIANLKQGDHVVCVRKPYAWLMIRGLRTLPIRLKQSSESAQKIASFLENHPKVEKVLYPFLATNDQYDLARRQMSGCSGMFSVILKTDSIERIEKFCESLRLFLLAVSWGGFESLVFPAVAMFDQGSASESDVPWNLVRFYIGLEDPEDLMADLSNALNNF